MRLDCVTCVTCLPCSTTRARQVTLTDRLAIRSDHLAYHGAVVLFGSIPRPTPLGELLTGHDGRSLDIKSMRKLHSQTASCISRKQT
jgi:hypothetical protein